ncbi:MAG TPA: hypothetical protein VG407_19010 [Caulobacteraceae bacterium]|jgi:hypothetical protein|nr:hypothetical protein [Caulobacteraceae bacterium]
MSSAVFRLRKTSWPTLSVLAGPAIALGALAFIYAMTADLNVLWGALAVILLSAYLLWTQRAYGVSVEGGEVIQRGAGLRKRIPVSDIVRVEKESSISGALSGHAFRRLAIYGHGKDLIGVSLKHFEIADIQKLLDILRSSRPDLALPKAPHE